MLLLYKTAKMQYITLKKTRENQNVDFRMLLYCLMISTKNQNFNLKNSR